MCDTQFRSESAVVAVVVVVFSFARVSSTVRSFAVPELLAIERGAPTTRRVCECECEYC